ncbi:hypothetical protein ABK040_002425 [Willaertia magna]
MSHQPIEHGENNTTHSDDDHSRSSLEGLREHYETSSAYNPNTGQYYTNNNHNDEEYTHHQQPIHHHHEDDEIHLNTAENVIRQPNNKRKVSKSIIGCLCTCCCCLPIGITILIVVYLLGLLLIAPEMTQNYSKLISESTGSGVTSETTSDFIKNIKKGLITENGLSYVLMQNSFKPKRFSALLQVFTGSLNEEDGELGISHMVEHMAFDNSKEYKGRGGVWQKIENTPLGNFNAWTDFRSTVYMLNDVKVSNIEDAMSIFYNQVQGAEFIQEYFDVERGAVLGEERKGNSSYYFALLKTLENHSGDSFRVGKRFPIGTADAIRSWTVADLKKYYDKWYVLSNMRLLIVGDANLNDLETSVKKFWSTKVTTIAPVPQQKEVGVPKPYQPILYIDEIEDFDAMTFALVASSPYEGYPRNSNYYRKETSDMMFYYYYTAIATGRYLLTYGDAYDMRLAGSYITNDYGFASKLFVWAILTPGAPEQSTFREDYKIAIEEMKRMADEDLNPAVLIALSFYLNALYSQGTYYANTQDSSELVQRLIGNEDPKYDFLNIHDELSAYSPYFGFSFALYSHTEMVKANAQFFVQSLSDIINENKPVLYPHIKRSNQVSSSIIMGKTNSPSSVPKPNKQTIIDHMKKILNQPISAVDASLGAVSQLGSLSSLLISSLPTLEDPPKLASSTAKVDYTNDKLGVIVYKLSNGLRVNIKKMNSKRKGSSLIEVVALGGKSTANNELKGACEFINEGIIGGSRYYNNKKEYFYSETRGVLPTITCSSDYISISTTLSAQCINYPKWMEDLTCQVTTMDYTSKLKALRLAIHPIYTSDVKEKVLEQYKKLDDLTFSLDLLTRLRGEIVERGVRKAFGNEHRVYTADSLKNVNPALTQYWVSQHFSLWKDGERDINRFEINLVGDFDTNNIIKQLDLWFGTIERETKPALKDIIGFDIYSKQHESNFKISFPIIQNFTDANYQCEVLSRAPDRAFIASVIPSIGVGPSQPSFSKMIFYNELLRAYAFDVIRSQHGFSYFAVVSSKPYILMDKFALSYIFYLAGTYPEPIGDDYVNIKASLNAFTKSMGQDIPETFFNNIKSSTASAIESELENEDIWFEFIRGVSLTSPSTYSSNFIRKEDDIDILSYIQNAKYDEFKAIFKEATQFMGREISAVLLTSKQVNNEC